MPYQATDITLRHSFHIVSHYFYTSLSIHLNMSRSRSYSPMTCQNSACQYYLIEEGKDIVRNGKTSAGHQQYFCRHCQKYFVETKNTPFYHARLDRRAVEIICKHSMEKPRFAALRGLRVTTWTLLPGTTDR